MNREAKLVQLLSIEQLVAELQGRSEILAAEVVVHGLHLLCCRAGLRLAEQRS